jgi:quercetin dioxygenase-like cupin family protein
MRQSLAAAGVVLAVLVCRAASAQTPGPEADPGVRPTRLIDRAEVRVSRVEIQPGATRRTHTHDDVDFHLWIPIEGTLELSMNSSPAVTAQSGQAYFMVRGTPHGFKNVGATPAAVFEIFIKPRAGAADRDLIGALALELASLGAPWPR